MIPARPASRSTRPGRASTGEVRNCIGTGGKTLDCSCLSFSSHFAWHTAARWSASGKLSRCSGSPMHLVMKSSRVSSARGSGMGGPSISRSAGDAQPHLQISYGPTGLGLGELCLKVSFQGEPGHSRAAALQRGHDGHSGRQRLNGMGTPAGLSLDLPVGEPFPALPPLGCLVVLLLAPAHTFQGIIEQGVEGCTQLAILFLALAVAVCGRLLAILPILCCAAGLILFFLFLLF